mmetsp:Transcript_6040/g.6578  ORF Transcript_6040/g.6578 Transcript_6040/m.6578 type:complete len:87 (-) Transcript_6040:388-648(-)
MTAHTVIAKMNMRLDHHNVKGHQDDTILLENLPILAQLNEHMDELAKPRLRITLNRTTHSPLDKLEPNGPISVYCNNLSSNLYDNI